MSTSTEHENSTARSSGEEQHSFSGGTPTWTVDALVKQCLPWAGHYLDDFRLGEIRVAQSPWERHRLASMRAWDPACGNGEIVGQLRSYFREVEASDLDAEGSANHIDFFGISDRPFGVDFIISRPPEDRVMEFCWKARSFAYEGVALLMPSSKLSEIIVPISKIASRYLDGFAPVAICPIHERAVPGHDGSELAWVIWPGAKYPDEVPGRLTPLDIYERMWNSGAG